MKKEEVLLQSSIDGEVIWGEPKKKHIVMLVGDKVNEEPKQETVEEAVKRICSNQDINYSGINTDSKYQDQEILLGKTISKKDADKDSFEDVTKYKKERRYSEEEVENILIEYVKTNPTKPYRVISWFTEFKNK